MKAEIIAVGNEVVFGHVVNTNASFLAQSLERVGILPQYHTAVCDEQQAIKEAVLTSKKRADVIILTGGLGPTKDDMTKEVVCEVLGLPLEINEEVLTQIEEYFQKTGKEMPSINKKQAAFPKEALILPNNCGTAPGCLIEVDNQIFILLPGPPKEMNAMFVESVLPYLRNKSSRYAKYLDINCFGIGESALAMRLHSLLGEYKWGSVATYIKDYTIAVRITVYGHTEEEIQLQLDKQKSQIENSLGMFIIGYNNEKIEDKVAQLLLEKHLQIATVESCTGGLVAGTLVNCGGISKCFKEGIVTYSNEAKMKYVGVKEETLRSVGAVSEETAKEMAEGIREASGADIGVSTTGIAGPDGGTKDKPVGLVYIGIATQEGTQVYRLQLNGTRQEVRQKTVHYILYYLYTKLSHK